VVSTDGRIHDRWTLIQNPDLKDPETGEKLKILCDVKDLREAIFIEFPERKDEFHMRRESYEKVSD
jgi:hypothetical protein